MNIRFDQRLCRLLSCTFLILIFFCSNTWADAEGKPSSDEPQGQADEFIELSEQLSWMAVDEGWALSLGGGTVGGRLAAGHKLKYNQALWLTAQDGSLSNVWGVSDTSYQLNARVNMLGLQFQYFPWQRGFYTHLSLLYTDNHGKGNFTQQYTQTLLDQGVLSAVSASDTRFGYHFSPWVLGWGVGWQGRLASMPANWGFSWQFGLLLQDRPEAFWLEPVPTGLSAAASDELLKKIEADLGDVNLLPDFSVQILYYFK